MPSCFNCDGDLGELRKPGREEVCDSCNSWIHCCKNCHFWDDSSRACEEPAAEWVHDRERANFCSFFALRSERRGSGASGGTKPSSSTRAAFDSLFKK